MAVTRIEEGGLGTDSFNLPVTLNGTDGSSTHAGDNIVLDASASGVDAGERLLYEGIPPDFANISDDTSVLAGATLTVNDNGAISVASGASVTIDSGATITNNGTATGFGGSDPSSADGDSLGTASLEWSDLYLADGGVIYFGNDQDITLTHVADTGLTLTSADAGSGSAPVLNLYRNSASPADGDDLARIKWTGKNDAGTIDEHGAIYVNLDTVNDGAEDSTMFFRIFQNGSAVNALYLASSSNTNQVVAAHTGSAAQPTWTFGGDLDSGLFRVGADELGIAVGGSRPIYSTNRKVCINDDATANMSSGLCINQTSYDDNIFECKSSDVAIPMTAAAEADTFFKITKSSSTEGRALLEGYSEGTGGVNIRGNYATANTSQATTSLAAVTASAYASDGGTGRAAPGANDNIFGVANATNTKFLVKGDGDFYYDGADQGAYDAYDDAHISRALDLSRGRGVIDSKFDKFIAYNHEKLADMKLVGREEDGTPNHFINVAGMQRLHNGAIWQQYERHENLLNAVYELAVEAVGEDKANSILDKNDIKLLSNNELLN